MKKKRVVITGLGPLTSIGTGKTEFWENVQQQKIAVNPIPESFKRSYTFKSGYYVPLPDYSAFEHGIPVMYSRLMQPEDKMAVIAMHMALKDAGYQVGEANVVFGVEGLEDAAIYLGTGFSGLDTAFKSYLAHVQDADISAEKKFRYNRMVIPMMMPNSPAAWCSIFYHQQGGSHTANAACASGTIAIGEAFRSIRDGYHKVVLTGGVECLHDDAGAIMRGFDILNTLTRADDGHPIPFSEQRSGFLFSEGGCCILILEELETALKRKAPIYAEIVDYHSLSDAFNIVQMEKTGEKVSELIKVLKGNHQIDYFNAHGTGTPPNDAIEAKSIIEVFGDKKNQPLINSSKSLLGHIIGASGAIEAAITALSVQQQKVHGNTVPDPMTDINLAGITINHQIEYAISTSYGFGGHLGGLLFKKF